MNFVVKFEKLDIGDYQLGKIVVERKTLSDLENSVLDKRIFSQAANLVKLESPIIIFEGDRNESRININSVRGIILSLATKFKIPVIFSKNEEETASYIKLMVNKSSSSPLSLRPSVKFKTKLDRVKYILEGFPGIGPVKSKLLIDKFKSFKGIVNSAPEELKKVIGLSTDKFIEIIN